MPREFFENLVLGVQLGAVYALIAVGYTMVYGVLRLINFAHGDVYMVGAYVGLTLAGRAGDGFARSPGGFVLLFVAAVGICA
ncbi:MAG: branched-chain amino acid ABC transporter permease, partial [Armatimonadetes bacterium]|nr:branched-chain amino acid ABC transporter permease [Armatimonadota bacterium]